MIPPSLKRAAASVIALCLCGQAALADVSQASVWSERRPTRKSPAPLLASLPQGLPPIARSLVRATPAVGERPIEPSSPLFPVLAAIANDRLNVVQVVGGVGSASPIVLIQDIHLNAEAQTNIAVALERFASEAGARSIYLEGGFGPLDFRRMRALPLAIRRPLAEDMLRHGRLGGPSLAAVVMDGAAAFSGADEEKPFRDNAAVVTAALERRPAAEADITRADRALADDKRSVYGPGMIAYDRLLDGYRGGSVTLGDFVARMGGLGLPVDGDIARFLDAYRLEKSLDFAKVEAERRQVLERLAARLSDSDVSGLIDDSLAYRNGRMGFAAYHERIVRLCRRHGIDLAATPAFQRYLSYVAMADRIDVNRLVAAVEDAQERLVAALAESPAERAIAARDVQLHLAGKLVRFELTPLDWRQWNVGKSRRDLPAALDLTLFERFYELADERSEILAHAVLSSDARSPAVLVAGGFHTEALVRALSVGKRPVVVVAPRITAIPDSGTRYLDAFTREKTPLDRLFAGERLTLNPPGQVLGGATGEGLSRTREFVSRGAALAAAAAVALPSGVSAVSAGSNVWTTQVDGVEALVATGPHDKRFADLEADPIAGTTVVRAPTASKFDWVPGTPGAWALVWAPLVALVRKIGGDKWADRLRPVISGLGEGGIAAALAMSAVGSPSLAIALLAAWAGVNAVMHYVFGVYGFNRTSQTWEIRRYIGRAGINNWGRGITFLGLYFALPDRQYLRANFVAATSFLAFSTAAAGGGLALTVLIATVPHILAGFTRERRIAQQRYRATEEKKLKFAENMNINAALSGAEIPDDVDRAAILEALEEGNDLASFTRFAATGVKNFRMVMLMQPGSTNDKQEGVGFKAFNDSIGQDLMNRVWRYRNKYTWDRAKQLFADAEAKAGRDVLVRVAGNYKSFRFAVNMEALEAAYPNREERERVLQSLLNTLTDDVQKHMLWFMTVKSDRNEDIGNGEIVGAVLTAQQDGKLPSGIKAVPMYWGMSDGPGNQRPGVPLAVEEVLALDAQTVNAINTVRARKLSDRGLGGVFDFEAARATVREIASDRAFLLREGRAVITLREVPGRAPELRLPQDLVEVYRKKADKIPAMLQKMFPDATDVEIAEINRRLASYISKLLSFDNVKPWVGSKEKPLATTLARRFNTALTLLRQMEQETDPAEKRRLWNEGRALAREALKQDVRMPELGSTFEFYGNVSAQEGRPDEAVVFIDFRGFGALMVTELEGTAERLTAADAAGPDRFREQFSAEMNTLGDRALDVFSASLLTVSATLARIAGASPIRFYFGGDDVSAILPRDLVYGKDGVPRSELINEIFAAIAPWMRIRVNIGSTTPYRERKDPVLETSLALTSMDDIVADAKAGEESWTIDGRQVSEVVTYSDKKGARYRMPVIDRQVGAAELVHLGYDNGATLLAKWLMTLYRRVVKRSSTPTEARDWAESKAEESILLLGGIVAALELPLLPFVPMLILPLIGVPGGILVGALIIVLFHEGTAGLSALRQKVRQYRGLPVTRAPPNPDWVERFWPRATARFVVSAMILGLAFFPVAGAVASGSFDPWSLNLGVYLVAWLAHAFWNSFAPAAWRLSLFRLPSGAASQANFNHPRENQDYLLSLDFPALNLRFRSVFDGFNGEGVGRQASREAARAARAVLRTELGRLKDPNVVTADLLAAILARASAAANEAVLNGASGGKSTGSLALIWGREVLVSQAGDSSAYLFQWDGKSDSFVKIGIDNLRQSQVPDGGIRYEGLRPTWALINRNEVLPAAVQERADLQKALAGLNSPFDMPDELAGPFFTRNQVANVLGDGDDYFPIVYRITVPEGQEGQEAALFLFSDGVTDNLTEEQMLMRIRAARTVGDASRTLVTDARDRMRAVDAARRPVGRILKFYDDLELIPPGEFERNREAYDAFVAAGRPAPGQRIAGVSLIRAYFDVRRDMRNLTPTPELTAAVDELRSIAFTGEVMRAKVDDATSFGEGVTTDGRLTPASILDQWLVQRLGVKSPLYRLYTVVLVNWELVFFLPLFVLSAFGATLLGLPDPTGAFGIVFAAALLPLTAAAFTAAHPNRTTAQKAALFRIALLLGLSTFAAALLTSSWFAFALPALIHSVYNAARLRDRLAALRDAEAVSRLLATPRVAAPARRRLVDIAAVLPLKLGVENAGRPGLSPLSTAVSERIDDWRDVDAVTSADAARLGRSIAQDLRAEVVGRVELGRTGRPMEMGSEASVYGQMGRERESRATPAEEFAYRFISAASAADAERDAAVAVAASGRLGAGRTVLVVEGEAAYAAVEALLKARGLDGLVQLVRWSPDLTMTALQDSTAAWLADRGLMTGDAAKRSIASATFRLVLPDPQAFTLPAGFLAGVGDLDRYRVFLMVQAVLLAVEIRPDSLENAQALALLVAKQA